ncbi:hypothetical protein LB523_08100 [Mesorhizobium sp. ESP-6-4]|nr:MULTISPECIES: hypothetical protein [unclassified Mesorhizobium]MBZ9659006.1 hypothetical protein [Mesorhizobium sp. ESP-6-4]MBZ9767699.1 hypothetical protein [Mesorhizobium sp. CA6]
MSEYQYYEFQAVDRPLGNADRHGLRDLSSRARITATSFTNFYEWGDFKGDPDELMERWFDLHLYWANWGSRRLMIKLPARLVDRDRVDAFLGATDDVMLRVAGENIIISIARGELEFEYLDDDSGWLSALAPLRADLLAGDLRLFYLLWLMAVEAGAIEPDEPEPMPGIGPLTEALEAFAAFFGIDRDLVQAAAERSATTGPDGAAPDIARRVVAAMSDVEKTSLLMRVFNGEPNMSPSCGPRFGHVWNPKRQSRLALCTQQRICRRGPKKSAFPASAPRRSWRKRSGDCKRRRLRRPAISGSRSFASGVKMSGKRPRPRSDGATPPATIKQRRSFPIYWRLPKNKAAPRISVSGFSRSGSATQGRGASSNAWWRWDRSCKGAG